MPEMPEVQGIVDFLGERAVGRTMTRTSVGEIAALKTYDPPNTALHGARITALIRSHPCCRATGSPRCSPAGARRSRGCCATSR